MSPRLVTVFPRRQKAAAAANRPAVVREAKAAFDRKELEAAAIAFDRVLLLLNDRISRRHRARPISGCSRPASGISAGWLPHPRLPRRQRAAERSSKCQTCDAPGPPRTYGPNDADVTPPVVVSQQLPPWRPSKLSATRRDYQGAVALVIDESGNVESVSLLTSLQPDYNPVLLKAAREWKFRPATRDGLPVRYRKVVGIRLKPSD
jgi:hypothetical protein